MVDTRGLTSNDDVVVEDMHTVGSRFKPKILRITKREAMTNKVHILIHNVFVIYNKCSYRLNTTSVSTFWSYHQQFNIL